MKTYLIHLIIFVFSWNPEYQFEYQFDYWLTDDDDDWSGMAGRETKPHGGTKRELFTYLDDGVVNQM